MICEPMSNLTFSPVWIDLGFVGKTSVLEDNIISKPDTREEWLYLVSSVFDHDFLNFVILICICNGHNLSREGTTPPAAPGGGLQPKWQSWPPPNPQFLLSRSFPWIEPAHLYPLSLHRAQPRLHCDTFLQSEYLQLCWSQFFRLSLCPPVPKPLTILAKPWPRGTSHTAALLPNPTAAQPADAESMDGVDPTGKRLNSQVGQCLNLEYG